VATRTAWWGVLLTVPHSPFAQKSGTSRRSEAGQALDDLRWVAAEVAKNPAVGEEGGVDLGVIEARSRAPIDCAETCAAA